MKKLVVLIAVTLGFYGCELSQVAKQDNLNSADSMDQSTGELSPKATWLQIGGGALTSGATSDLSMDIYNNEPYVAYADFSNSFRLQVKKCVGGTSCTSWTGLGANISANEAYDISLAVWNGTPFVVYRELVTVNPLVFSPKVKYYNGTSWLDLGNIASLVGANVSFDWYPTIAVEDGTVFIVAKNRVMSYDGSNWSYIGGAIPGCNGYPIIKVHNTGTDLIPFVAFIDSTEHYNASVVYYNDVTNTWDYLGNKGFSSVTDPWQGIGSLAFELSSDGTPYVFFAGMYDSSIGKSSVLRYDDILNDWVNVGTPANYFQNIALSHTDVTIGSDNSVYVAYHYQGNSLVTVQKSLYGTGAWSSLGTVSGSWGNYTNICLDSNNVPFVAYENHSSSPNSYVKKYQ